MPRRATKITVKQVSSLPPGMHADGDGLYLQVMQSGAKSWIFRYKAPDGRRREMGLGSVVSVGLARARELAGEHRAAVAAGLDPLSIRQRDVERQQAVAVKAITFREAAGRYIEARRAGWSSIKHAAQWDATLTSYAYPHIGDKEVGGVTTPDILAILTPIWAAKAETAARVRGRIEMILDYARVQGWREGDNPARWKGHLALTLPSRAAVAPPGNHESMNWRDIQSFWPRLLVQDGLGARAMQMAILTATRSSEVLGATWTEFDLDAATWTIPAERMKAGRQHVVPLSAPALELLRALRTIRRADDGYVFPGQKKERPLSNMSMAMALRRMNLDVTPHGFRSTFRTWAAECTNFQHEVCEAALAHTVSDKVVAAYQRGDFMDKRKMLMDAWASFVTTPIDSGKVVSIRKK